MGKIIAMCTLAFLCLTLVVFAQDLENYDNKEFKISIQHPKDWQVFDQNTHPEVFKTLLALKNPGTDLICALSCGKNWNSLNPIIMVMCESVNENSRDLSAEDMAMLMDKSIREALQSSPTMSIIEYPTVVSINNKKLVKYIATADNGKVKGITYIFVKGTKCYTIGLSTDPEDLIIYKQVFDNIAGSINIY